MNVYCLEKTYGKKIPDKYESPIDSLLSNFTETLNPFYFAMGFTPNTLTTLSIIFTLVGLYIYQKSKPKTTFVVVGAIFYFIGYYFDCADGNFARKYNMLSEFGDYYDHISDCIKISILFYVVYSNCPKHLLKPLCLVASILHIFLLVQTGCQEKMYGKDESPSLSFTKEFCFTDRPQDWLQITRFFSAGTYQLIITILLVYLKWKKD